MSDSTLRVRLFEAPHCANVLLAFVCLSNVLSVRQRLALIRIAIRENASISHHGGI
jgi:hypothetical protein